MGFSEIDKYAQQIYLSHFPSHHPYGDITRIAAESLPAFDLLVGGFPCQSFSVAGKRRGFADTRGTLFFDLARILQAKRPRLCLFENVKGLLSHDDGRTFKTIIATLDELGYDLQWQVLNSKDFGVPQNRERVFIVGHSRSESRPEVFPVGDCLGEDRAEDVREAEGFYTGTLSTKNNGPQCQFDCGTTLIYQRARGNDAGGVKAATVAPTVTKGFGDGNLAVYPGHAVNKPSSIASTLKAGVHGVPGGEGLVGGEGMAVRRLTPVECERLQGYPDGWTVGASDTQRYKCLGNAVTTNVVREVVKGLRHEN